MPSSNVIAQRLAALEAEAAELRKLLAGDATIAQVAQQQHHDPEVRITEIAEPLAPLPSTKQLETLYGIVLHHNPQLKPQRRWMPRDIELDYQDADFAEFTAAFTALAMMRRIPRPDTKRAPSYWLDILAERLRQAGRPGDLTTSALVAAALAHGDIAYRPLDDFPYGIELGLSIGGQGHPYNGAWRQILTTRALDRAMMIETRARRPEVAQINIIGGNHAVGLG
ncbi:hypothetical protein [Bradyrhizobium viridifuturi]|uniref:hypothetical protein n=1 Tax=Bradyrhizobium viridifuturi TaxID=1654716 RepID=UPI00067F544B|nr:hypothetical protein [Bradyrhizobium viridifuturi]